MQKLKFQILMVVLSAVTLPALSQNGSKEPEFSGWTFSASEALRVHGSYTLKDFRIPNANTKYAWLHMNEFMPTASHGDYQPGISVAFLSRAIAQSLQ